MQTPNPAGKHCRCRERLSELRLRAFTATMSDQAFAACIAKLDGLDDLRLAATFAWIREGLGWRQSDMAAETGISESYYCRLENGTRTPEPVTLRHMLISLNLPPHWRKMILEAWYAR